MAQPNRIKDEGRTAGETGTRPNKPWRTLPEPPIRTTRTRHSLNVIGILIAVAGGILLIPATYRYQLSRIPPPNKREWRMYDLVAVTETKAIERFGKPTAQKEYQLTKGSVMGPLLGQKNYVPLDSPDYDKRLAAAKVAWIYPAYSAIRELTWKLTDSYLTIWFQEPRAEMTFSDDNADLALPATGPGEWVALDNYRLGFGLVGQTEKVEGRRQKAEKSGIFLHPSALLHPFPCL